MQQYPLLQTKLYVPPIRADLVSRPRLVERLNAGLATRGGFSRTRDAFSRASTLISASAGFGKTTARQLRISGNLNLLKERGCDRIPIGSAESPSRRHDTERLCSMQTMGASTDMFLIVTCSDYLCRGVLLKHPSYQSSF